LWSPDSKKWACSASIDGESGLYTVEFPDKLTPKLLARKRLSQAVWSAKAKAILYSDSGVPAKLETSGSSTRYPFSTPQTFSRSERFGHGFDVAWRIMRDRWYDPRVGNRNWDQIRRRYRPMAAAAVNNRMFGEVMTLMLGELNGSHLGFTPRSDERWSDRESARLRQTAHLGLRFDPEFNGPGLKIRDVIPGGPTDDADIEIEPGDLVLQIDGQKVDPAMDLTQVLNGRSDRDIELLIASADGDEETTITIRPTSYGAVRSRLYQAWLTHNREMVDQLSDNTLGYLHIRAMSQSSFYEFERQLYNAGAGKDGLVIDVRDNGGGSTTDLLLTCLTQPRHSITIPRDGGPGYPQSRMVFATWHKPIIVLCNQNSYSNAEIFSHAIKGLGRGKLVGVTTAGGVISTGSTSVIDVGRMRMPFRAWFVAGTGEDMELNGAVPDVTLWPLPGELPSGKDRQLAKAVEMLKDDVAKVEPMPKLIYNTQRGSE
ncbi:MAG: S41 family peptidase, partial [Planctomycetota bacterium]